MMNATEAKARADEKASTAAKQTEDELAESTYQHAVDICDNHVAIRTTEGKWTAWLEPFNLLGSKAHMPPTEDVVMARLVETLQEAGYHSIEWDRRDKRVVLRFSWAAQTA